MKKAAACLLATLGAAMPVFAQKQPAPITVSMKTADGKDAGTARLTAADNGVRIEFRLQNLPPGEHGVHVHEHAACDPPDFKSAGGHLNPAHKEHGSKNPQGPHAGDIPVNLTVQADGTARKTVTVRWLSMSPDVANSVLANGGTSLMVHAKADDMMTSPSGNSGDRIACGIIAAPAM
jgi:Cu-Zn family superoxide dismutase